MHLSTEQREQVEKWATDVYARHFAASPKLEGPVSLCGQRAASQP